MAQCLYILGFILLFSGVTSQSATCDIQVNSDLPEQDKQPISGTVTFTTESSGDVKVVINLSGFNTTDGEDVHGFHIHENGDLSQGCTSTGSHYNPDSVPHAGRENATRHVGDLGNIDEDGSGNVNTEFTDSIIKLSGDQSVIDRAVVIHASFDDLGVSGDAAGNAGARLACCIITSESAASGLVVNTILLLFISVASVLKNIL